MVVEMVPSCDVPGDVVFGRGMWWSGDMVLQVLQFDDRVLADTYEPDNECIAQ